MADFFRINDVTEDEIDKVKFKYKFRKKIFKHR